MISMKEISKLFFVTLISVTTNFPANCIPAGSGNYENSSSQQSGTTSQEGTPLHPSINDHLSMSDSEGSSEEFEEIACEILDSGILNNSTDSNRSETDDLGGQRNWAHRKKMEETVRVLRRVCSPKILSDTENSGQGDWSRLPKFLSDASKIKIAKLHKRIEDLLDSLTGSLVYASLTLISNDSETEESRIPSGITKLLLKRYLLYRALNKLHKLNRQARLYIKKLKDNFPEISQESLSDFAVRVLRFLDSVSVESDSDVYRLFFKIRQTLSEIETSWLDALQRLFDAFYGAAGFSTLFNKRSERDRNVQHYEAMLYFLKIAMTISGVDTSTIEAKEGGRVHCSDSETIFESLVASWRMYLLRSSRDEDGTIIPTQKGVEHLKDFADRLPFFLEKAEDRKKTINRVIGLIHSGVDHSDND